ncbi:sulfate ABC transporter substrate-binding protein [Halotalea alkalilenta]|uniref:sulfate ABC transporter substrate-binding protein n=1 Tax=Halotalea alkalilenta TaxID=376489 RepID=UPI0006942B57|nr:sulfate ABC transporter substrate-binding protein [Halotalea alkalilenta]
MSFRPSLVIPLALAAALILPQGARAESITLLNVSYDPTRELYQDYNAAFREWYRTQSGDDVTVQTSHGGSGSQARSVIEGAPADVVTLALAYDIDAVAQRNGGVAEDWQQALPDNSTPYTSTIVFLVRKGNPKNIHDWDDLIRDDVSVITPNPKTSGGARWNYLAAWAWALKQQLGDLSKLDDPAFEQEVAAAQEHARDYVSKLYANVAILDSGARGATNTFIQRGQGDVLLAWENEAFLATEELGEGEYEIVAPSLSILTEPPVALVEGNVSRKGEAAERAARAYLEHLYSPEGQRIAAAHYYRPRNPQGVPAEDLARFPELDLVTIDDVFGGWSQAQSQHFGDNGVFDQIFRR